MNELVTLTHPDLDATVLATPEQADVMARAGWRRADTTAESGSPEAAPAATPEED